MKPQKNLKCSLSIEDLGTKNGLPLPKMNTREKTVQDIDNWLNETIKEKLGLIPSGIKQMASSGNINALNEIINFVYRKTMVTKPVIFKYLKNNKF